MIIDNIYNIKGQLCSIQTENGRIVEIGPAGTGQKDQEYFDGHGLTVLPGMVDVHTHGLLGMDALDGRLGDLAGAYASIGTTTFLPTAMCAGNDDLMRLTESDINLTGAHIPGFHLEGPYISKEKAGAQNSDFIKSPQISEFNKFRNVRMVTIAPETDPDCEFTAQASQGCIVSLGHTNCSYEQAIKAIDAGANCLTHTFNAMPPLLHRAPGPIGAAVEKQIYVQLICDGIHIAKPVIQAAFRLFPGRVVLISDSIRPTGMPDGTYDCGGLPVRMKNGRASLAQNEGTLAGSTTTLLGCVRKAVEFGIPAETAVDAATRIPAEMLGLNKGVLAPGFDADLILVDKDLQLKEVFLCQTA